MNFLSTRDVICIRAQQHPGIFLLAILMLGVKVAQNKGMFESPRQLAIFHLHLTSLLLSINLQLPLVKLAFLCPHFHLLVLSCVVLAGSDP